MKSIRLSILAAAVVASLTFSACTTTQSTSAVQATPLATKVSQTKLIEGNWDAFNRAKIDELIATYGKFSANYNAAKPPYVVFDWDNTMVFLDIAEASLIYQLENLRFKATPEQLDKAVRMNVPSTDFKIKNVAGQAINIDKLASDINKSYTWLYQNYVGLNGDKSLNEVKKAPQYKDFITKVRFAYEAIGETFDVSVSYPWVTYLFTGMTEADVRALTAETAVWQEGQPVESVKWQSPAELPGAAGAVAVSWKNGLRLLPEMKDLIAKLRAAGIDVWFCSASFIDIIKEISSNPAFGYNNPDTRVIAMELERDANGVIQSEYRKGFDQTQGPGKTKEIRRLITPKYGYDPIFIAGDSEGDQNMMKDFDGVKLVLIINRLRSPKSIIGEFSKIAVDTYKKPDAKYLLQGRDDNKGTFVPSQLHYKLGTDKGQALR